MSPFSGSRGTRTHKRVSFATCFQDRLLIQPDDFHSCVARISSGGWNRTNDLLVQSQAPLPTAATPKCFYRVRGEGFEPPQPGSKPGGLPLADPRVIHRECSAGIEPACSAWKADAFADRPRAQSGRRGSRTLKAHRSTVFETVAIANWLALPYSQKLRRQESNLRRSA